LEARGSAVGWGTALKPERRWFNVSGIFQLTWFFQSHSAMGLTEPLTESSIRNVRFEVFTAVTMKNVVF
jgi:hypothetical protein